LAVDATALEVAAFNGHLEVVECIVEAYQRKRKRDSSNPLRKALEYAVQMNHMRIVKYLISEEPNLCEIETSDKSLLQQATRAGNLELVCLLVEERKADVNEKYNANMTPLHFASQLGNLEIVKYLVVKGGDVDAQDTFGQTPLHLAVKRNNLNIVELLLEKGAPLNIASRDGVKFLIHFPSLFIFCY
jgi:ankyrin repeat protein